MLKVFTIYKAFHKETGKSYIGFDSSWPKRKNSHIRQSQKNPRQYLHNAIRKYGADSFEWEVIYNSTDREHCLEMEKHFIQEYNTFEEGYNLTLGGEGKFGTLYSEETRRKMSQSRKGIKHSEETKQRFSEMRRGQTSPNKGKTFTDEHRKKLSEAKLGKGRDEETRKKISDKLKGRVSPNKGRTHIRNKKRNDEDGTKHTDSSGDANSISARQEG